MGNEGLLSKTSSHLYIRCPTLNPKPETLNPKPYKSRKLKYAWLVNYSCFTTPCCSSAVSSLLQFFAN